MNLSLKLLQSIQIILQQQLTQIFAEQSRARFLHGAEMIMVLLDLQTQQLNWN